MARKDITLEVLLNIFNPLETFTPRTVEAELLALSDRSVRIRTTALNEQECKMLDQMRFISKITFATPFLPRRVTLKAEIFWAKYILADPNAPAYCDLGFNFQPPKDEDAEYFQKILDHWNTTG